MNAIRTRIVAEGTGYPGNSRSRTLILDQEPVLCGVGIVLAMLALWPISLGQVRGYTFLTLAALLVIRSSNWVRVEEDESAINADVDVPWPAPQHFAFF